ncbi:MAG: hypothetical protein KDC92_05990, partial [Bacteroidetes bacterium]|nr:hypothetical protein [Bacteroidota bacterium]
MAKFEDHLNQARSNLKFLEVVNEKAFEFIDWQVTVCFYTSLHLINAHLAKHQLQYRSHTDVKNAINPKNPFAVSKLQENEYVAYVTLQMLSRRSRYLVQEKDSNIDSDQVFLTYEKHLSKALRHLDCLISYFNQNYSAGIPKATIRCDLIK